MSKTKTSKTTVRVTLSTFDDHGGSSLPIYRCLRKAQSLKSFAPITAADYLPRGSTPLIDASVQFIKQLRSQAKSGEVHVGLLLDESGSMGPNREATITSANAFVENLRTVEKVDPEVDGKGFLVIATDGQENVSREFKYEDVTALLRDCEDDGWVVIFLGAGIDAWAQGSALGLSGTSSGQTVSSVNTPSGLHSAFASVATDSSGYLTDSKGYHALRSTSSVRKLSEDGQESVSGHSSPPILDSKTEQAIKDATARLGE